MSGIIVGGYVVRRQLSDGTWEVLSAWPDLYAARFEASRWEQDLKIKHDFVEGAIVIPAKPKETIEEKFAAVLENVDPVEAL